MPVPALTLTFLGTGGAQQVPAFGCRCPACERARNDPAYRRRPCSAMLQHGNALTLLDAGLHDLTERFTPENISQFLLTHYHMDHVQGLFPLRWGYGDAIPVYGPPDAQGCDDLYKHPGILDFSHHVAPFETFTLQDIRVTPLPLNHSRLTFGYLFDTGRMRLAYLTDTAGLPDATLHLLRQTPPDVMVIDCSHPPAECMPSNHNDLGAVIALCRQIAVGQTILTHIGHRFDAWMMENPLPHGMHAARDGERLELE